MPRQSVYIVIVCDCELPDIYQNLSYLYDIYTMLHDPVSNFPIVLSGTRALAEALQLASGS